LYEYNIIQLNFNIPLCIECFNDLIKLALNPSIDLSPQTNYLLEELIGKNVSVVSKPYIRYEVNMIIWNSYELSNLIQGILKSYGITSVITDSYTCIPLNLSYLPYSLN